MSLSLDRGLWTSGCSAQIAAAEASRLEPIVFLLATSKCAHTLAECLSAELSDGILTDSDTA